MTPELRRLIHFATVAAVVRYTVAELRHSHDPAFRTAHLKRPEFDMVRDMVDWNVYGFTQSFCARYRAENVKDILVDPQGIENIWKRVGKELDCSSEGGACNCYALTGRRSEIIGLTEKEQVTLVDHNQKMYLAVTVGYIRCTLARISRREDDYECARGHLTQPSFATLPEEVRGRIDLEICEYWKDGMLNGAPVMVDAALSRNHNFFWSMANRSIGCGMPVEPTPISPELLPEDLFPAPEIIMKKKENALLHLALVVAYVRLCQKRAAGADAVTSVAFAKAHLEFPAFSGLSDASRTVVMDELLKLSDDGNGTSDQGAEMIKAAVAGNYGPCWRLANKRLAARTPPYDWTIMKPIDPNWLL